eukprot:Hpha_TRINITY_DN9356_c0_g2::TRINITY_DN9356_c0_g2_i1::g.26034::m.26034
MAQRRGASRGYAGRPLADDVDARELEPAGIGMRNTPGAIVVGDDGKSGTTLDSKHPRGGGTTNFDGATIDEIPLSQLPPIPPADGARCGEVCLGISVVSILVTLLVGMTFTVSKPPQELEQKAWSRPWAIFGILLWATIAMLSLVRLVLGDMGEVRRGAKNTYPIPLQVAERIHAGKPLRGMQNIPGEGGMTYCVRCLVWRPPRSDAHHCSTCQRCTVGFDHHCGVFGRCIAWGPKNGLKFYSGNMPFFLIILLMFAAGIVTFVFAAVTRPHSPSTPRSARQRMPERKRKAAPRP